MVVSEWRREFEKKDQAKFGVLTADLAERRSVSCLR